MRIVFLSHWFLPNKIGGSELALYRFAREMAERGHECHVITRLDSIDRPAFEIMEGIHVHRLKKPGARIIGPFLYGLKAARLVRRLVPDVVHEQAIQGLGPIVKRFCQAPYILFPRSTGFCAPANVYARLVARTTLRHADVLLGQSGSIAMEMRRLCGKEVSVIPNGVEPERFAGISKPAARKKLGIADGEKVLLCVANLHRIKGHCYLLQAMETVAESVPGVRLFLVGRDHNDGSIPATALERLKQHIVLTGQVPPEEIPVYMAAADIFVLPSLSEGVPNVLLEAMAAGLPVVATDVGGVPELIADGENGLLVKPGNSEQLAAKLLALLKDDALRERMALRNRREAKKYAWPAIIDSLEKVYLETGRR